MAAIVHCHNLHKSFDQYAAVAGVGFEMPAGEILALVGPSGCGKTTTLRLVAGFEPLDHGQIVIAGQVVDDGRQRVPPERRRVGMVFQDYAIFPHLSVAENLAFGLNGGRRQLTAAHAARVDEMLRFVGLTGLGERMPHELSG
ncbi:MAG: ABC transporter ATP-binding protein, partial [Anaerolineales bacterium]|nr:ABC transporter ATP-binding protein [Anaerolineales bacterium]